MMITNQQICDALNGRFVEMPRIAPHQIDRMTVDEWGYTFVVLFDEHPPMATSVDVSFVVEFPELCGITLIMNESMPYLLIERLN